MLSQTVLKVQEKNVCELRNSLKEKRHLYDLYILRHLNVLDIYTEDGREGRNVCRWVGTNKRNANKTSLLRRFNFFFIKNYKYKQ